MKFLFLLAIIYIPFLTHAQVSTESKKIKALLGDGFISLKPNACYNFSTTGPNVKAVPSTTIWGDTSGLISNRSYLMFRNPIAFEDRPEVFRYLRTGFVTNSEYDEFQKWILDSIARDEIYFTRKSNEDAFKMLLVADNDLREKAIDNISDRQGNRELYNMDQNIQVDFMSPENQVLLADRYLPYPERFYGKKTIDERKLFYKFWEDYSKIKTSAKDAMLLKYLTRVNSDIPDLIRFETATISDHYLWAENSKFQRDEASVLAQTYHLLDEFSAMPVQGITGLQAAAYCHWKQVQLQEQFDAKKIKVRVIVTLPTEESQPGSGRITIPEYDYNSQWQITFDEYSKFVAEVRDSVLKETLYAELKSDQDAMTLLKYKQQFLDEMGLEWTKFKPGERISNRHAFSLSKDKIRLKDQTLVASVQNSDPYKNPRYVYSDFDAGKAGQKGTYGEGDYVSAESGYKRLLEAQELDENEEIIGKDLNLDYYNELGFSTSGARSFENLQRFFLYTSKEIAVIPEGGLIFSDNFSAKLSYDQAIAFYHWKFRIYELKETDHWQKFVLPSVEQFAAIRQGNKVLSPQRELDFPGNVFRYEVHIFTK